MGSFKGQAGTDGLRTAGFWKWGSKESQSRESALTFWDHHHCSPHQTTLTAALPPAGPPASRRARHHPTTTNSFGARRICSESAILHTYALHGIVLVSFWAPDGNIYKHVAPAEPSINTLGSYMPSDITPLDVREDQRSRTREEMEVVGSYSAGYTVN